MVYFAELDSDNVIIQIIVIAEEKMLDAHGIPQESIGIAFCQELTKSSNDWKLSKKEGGFRCRPALIGDVYNPTYDVFLAQQPYPSWSLDTSTFEWVPPVPRPILTPEQRQEGYYVQWNEQKQEWDILQYPT